MPPANCIYKLAIQGTVGGQQHISTLHMRSPNNSSSLAQSETAFMTGLINAWKAQCRTAYQGMFGTGDLPILQYSARKVCGAEPLPAGVDAAESAGSQAGSRVVTSLGDAAAPWLASTLTFMSSYAGRSYRGRNYFGGLFEADLQGASLSATYVALVQAYANGLNAGFIALGESGSVGTLFVFSRTLAHVPGTQCQNSGADVVQLSPRTLLATMKSRKSGRGR